MAKKKTSFQEKLTNLFNSDPKATVAFLNKSVSVNASLKDSPDIPTKPGNSSENHYMTVADALEYLCDCKIEMVGEIPKRPNNPKHPKIVEVTELKITQNKKEEEKPA